MMRRDERLTGHRRGQSVRFFLRLGSPHEGKFDTFFFFSNSQVQPVAPPEFATNTVWYAEPL